MPAPAHGVYFENPVFGCGAAHGPNLDSTGGKTITFFVHQTRKKNCVFVGGMKVLTRTKNLPGQTPLPNRRSCFPSEHPPPWFVSKIVHDSRPSSLVHIYTYETASMYLPRTHARCWYTFVKCPAHSLVKPLGCRDPLNLLDDAAAVAKPRPSSAPRPRPRPRCLRDTSTRTPNFRPLRLQSCLCRTKHPSDGQVTDTRVQFLLHLF